ncbi:MAG: hypothetical protein COW30_06575 [Rhodospirillales bacterium CG15_BIG_FIL_POST_REV_8_21_14_020_66_15]|nr:MAG: hypothetical protein COW30_06575 [Rhodospirillales bacterium CG15_BIG_FIL_POST_REV_8_21_14_020_66_15]
MLREWVSHLTTPAPEAAKRLGYLKEQIAIAARHRRLRHAWKEHLERSRRFVLWSAANCPAQDKVTILGSGGLLDVPLGELADDFAEVVLVDILHPPAVRAWAAQYANVYLVDADLTGLVDGLAEGTVPDEPPEPIFPDADADLVVSLNLLGQLPLIPARHVPDKQAGAFSEAVQRQHLRALQALPGRVCLITETVREYVEDGAVDETEPALGDIRLPEPDESWTWNLAPAPELERARDLRLRIAAYSNLFKK